MQITSLQHPIVKHFVLLKKEAQYRKEKKTLVLIGEKVIREYPKKIKTLLSLEPLPVKAESSYLVTEDILHKIAGLKQYVGAIAEVDLPEMQEIQDPKYILILDQIQDPGNAGTLLRTALGLNWDIVIATQGTVDFFNDKVIRASSGAIFHIPYCIKTYEEISLLAKKKNWTFYIADAEGNDIKTTKASTPLALILSNEGQGLSEFAKKIGKKISIPLHNKVESLNVATAGAILLYELKKES